MVFVINGDSNALNALVENVEACEWWMKCMSSSAWWISVLPVCCVGGCYQSRDGVYSAKRAALQTRKYRQELHNQCTEETFAGPECLQRWRMLMRRMVRTEHTQHTHLQLIVCRFIGVGVWNRVCFCEDGCCWRWGWSCKRRSFILGRNFKGVRMVWLRKEDTGEYQDNFMHLNRYLTLIMNNRKLYYL